MGVLFTMTRRTLLATAAGAAARTLSGMPPSSKVGIASSCFAAERSSDTLAFLDYCHSLGAAGIQCALSSLEPDYIHKLRARAEQSGMYVEVMAELPKTDDTTEFERTMQAAKEAGALAVRVVCLSGRRYENFTSVADWQAFTLASHTSISRAVPIAEKHRVPLAVENHKDWTLEDLEPILRQKSSEFLGVCLDTGNNIALLDDPMAVVEALAPYAVSVHFKDVGVEPYAEGFLIAEVPLGEGMLDLRKMQAVLAKARPATRLSMEMITRNPLKVPCLTDAYWATFPKRNGLYLARTMALVHDFARRLEPLPRVDGINGVPRQRLEEDNVKQCLHYARVRLNL